MTKHRPAVLIGFLFCATLFLYHNGGNSVNNFRRRLEERRYLQFDPSTILRKSRLKIGRGTVAVIINTPKTGTGGLTHSFVRNFKCNDVEDAFPNVAHYGCEDGKDVLRTHYPDKGAEALAAIRPLFQEREKCVVVTAIRDPRTWLPSLFMQNPYGGRKLCNADISREDFFEKYHEWLITENERIRETSVQAYPALLAHFGSTSLAHEFKKMDASGGYSLLSMPDPLGPFNDCELLFLRMEESVNWAGIISKVVPGVTYRRNKSRGEECPAIASHYHALQQYEYTEAEKRIIVGGDADVAEYFSVYGLLDGKEQTQSQLQLPPAIANPPKLGMAPGAVALILNTPKTGTGGLTNTFARNFRCADGLDSFHKVAHYSCHNGMDVLRTHYPSHAAEALAALRPNIQERTQCLVVTSIRDPRTWLPSLFMQSPLGGRSMCKADVSREIFFEKYHDWIMTQTTHIQDTIIQVRPPLLQHFGSTGLEDEFKTMDANGGYSLLTDPDPIGAFANCKLLFLRMEDSQNWPSIFDAVMPGVKYTKNKSRSEECPAIASHYQALQDYHYSEEEKDIMTGRNVNIAAYFNVYGL